MFERIAFLKLCCPGDLLFTTPAVRAVRVRYPDARLIYLTGRYSSFIPVHNPHIDETLIVPPPFEMRGGLRSIRAMLKGISTVAGNKFDLAISFHRSSAVAGMARFGRSKEIISFETARPLATRSAPFDPDKHEVLRYLDLASLANTASAGQDLEYQTTEAEDDDALKILSQHGISVPFAAIAPGGGENPGTIMHIKRWPAPNFRAVAHELRDCGLRVIAVGSNSERILGDAVGADANLAGITTFPQLAAIFRHASLVVANDSGPLYLASAVGAKTVGIYGPSSPKLVAPFSNKHRSVVNPVFCHPCYRPDRNVRGTIECPLGHWACMLTLPVDQVMAAANELLAAA